MADIVDVARAAGVSTATVSRALRGLPNVSPATRDRVRDAAPELDYQVSRYASALATGRTHTVRVVVPHVGRWFFGQVVAGADVLRHAGLDLLLYSMGDRPALALPLTVGEAATMRRLGIPLALVGRDRRGAARRAGHRRWHRRCHSSARPRRSAWSGTWRPVGRRPVPRSPRSASSCVGAPPLTP